MDQSNCEHQWKIHVGASHKLQGFFPAIYMCEKCRLTMEASSVIQLKAIDSMNSLQKSIGFLQQQISTSSVGIRQTMSYSADKLSKSVDEFKTEIQKYVEVSNKHATAIKWLTGGLVFVGLVQIIVILILNFSK